MNSTMSARRPTQDGAEQVVGLAGARAGLLGGLAMVLLGAGLAVLMGEDVWLAPRRIAAVVYGAGAAQPGFDLGQVLVGTAVHFAVSAALGAIFEVWLRRMALPVAYGVPVVAGLVFGAAVWLIAYFVVLPVISPALLQSYAPAFIAQHLLFGIVTGLGYARLAPRRRP